MHLSYGGGQLKLCATSSPPFQGMATMQVVCKNHDYRRISGPSLLEVRCCQHSHGMQLIVSLMTHDTQMPLYHARVVWRLSLMILQKCSKLQHILLNSGLPWGVTSSKRGEDTPRTHMYHRAKFHADSCHRH